MRFIWDSKTPFSFICVNSNLNLALKLFYRKSGSGKPIVILHGLLGMSDNWVSFANRFPEGYEVFLPDLRNHGQSPHDSRFDYTCMAEDLHVFLMDLSLHEVTLIGHSMGGKLAMVFAFTYPDLIKKLIVIDMAPRYYSPHHGHIFAALENLDLSKITSRAEAAQHLAIQEESTKLFLLKNLFRNTENNQVFAWRFNLQGIRENLPEIGKEIKRSDDANPKYLPFQTLFVKGENSEYIKREDLPLMGLLFPGFQMAEIKNAGHWVHADQPEMLFQEILAFFEA